jgi:hypothetical protein
MKKIIIVIALLMSLITTAEPVVEFHSIGSDNRFTNLRVAPIQIDSETHWLDDETPYYLVPADMTVFLNNIVNTTVHIDTDNENPKSYKQALNSSYGKYDVYRLLYELTHLENMTDIEYYISNVSSSDAKLKESKKYLESRSSFKEWLNDMLVSSVIDQIPVEVVSTSISPDMFTEQLSEKDKKLIVDIAKDVFPKTSAEIDKIPQDVFGNEDLWDYSISVMVQQVGGWETLPVVPVLSNDDWNEIKDKPKEIKKRLKNDVVTTTVVVTRVVYKDVEIIAVDEQYYIIPLAVLNVKKIRR